MKQTGIIYLIRNNVNSRVYVGQTIQKLEGRIRNYRSEVNYTDSRRPIIRAMRKYGMENFTFEVLFEGEVTPQELTDLEEEYIIEYRSVVLENGYNLKRAAEHGGHGEDTKRKIGEAQVGKLNHMYGRVGKHNPTSIPVIELTTGKKFQSIREATNFFGASHSHAASVARGERGSTSGRVFRHLEDGEIRFNEDFCKIKALKTREAVLPQFKKYIN